LLGFTKQAFYKKGSADEKTFIEAELILQEVQKIRSNHKRAGTRKLHKMLETFFKEHNIKLGRDGLFDMLREFGMLIKPLKRNYCTTNSYHRFYKYPNLVKEWQPLAPNKLWVSDITYIEVDGKFMYLSVITDAFSRKIVGWHLSESYSAEGTIQALKMALSNNKNIEGLIHHSDRGVQYCSKEYVAILKSKNIQISMTENGDPYENALAERVNGILKTEYLDKQYDDKQKAKKDVTKSVRLYNTERLHMSIGMKTPEYVHQTSTVTNKHWKNYKKKKGQPINSKGNNAHQTVNAISPCFFPNSKINELTY
jgi:transposase InsO family protein